MLLVPRELALFNAIEQSSVTLVHLSFFFLVLVLVDKITYYAGAVTRYPLARVAAQLLLVPSEATDWPGEPGCCVVGMYSTCR